MTTSVPYIFNTRIDSIKLAELDADFAALAAMISTSAGTASLILDGGHPDTLYDAGAHFIAGNVT
jgi:hypothetical protein